MSWTQEVEKRQSSRWLWSPRMGCVGFSLLARSHAIQNIVSPIFTILTIFHCYFSEHGRILSDTLLVPAALHATSSRSMVSCPRGVLHYRESCIIVFTWEDVVLSQVYGVQM
jgi:hypothetical protein